MAGFDGIFALSTADSASAKLLATAFARLNRRMGRATTDRGRKDIGAVAALLRAGLLDATELRQSLDSLELPPALPIEAENVFEETKEAAARTT